MQSPAINRMNTMMDYTMRSQNNAFAASPMGAPTMMSADLLPYATGKPISHIECHELVSEPQDLTALDNIETSLSQVQMDINSFFTDCNFSTDWSTMQESVFSESGQEGMAVFPTASPMPKPSQIPSSVKMRDAKALQTKLRDLAKLDYELQLIEDGRTDSMSDTTMTPPHNTPQLGTQAGSPTSPPWMGYTAPRSSSDQTHSRTGAQRPSQPRPLLPRAASVDQKPAAAPKPSRTQSQGTTQIKQEKVENDTDVQERRERNRVASIRFRERQRERQKNLSTQLKEYKARSRLLEEKIQSLKTKLNFYQRLLLESDMIEDVEKF